jgi:hypothetical protein
MQVIGRRGGQVKGPNKRRGDKSYYRNLALKRWNQVKEAME